MIQIFETKAGGPGVCGQCSNVQDTTHCLQEKMKKSKPQTSLTLKPHHPPLQKQT